MSCPPVSSCCALVLLGRHTEEKDEDIARRILITGKREVDSLSQVDGRGIVWEIANKYYRAEVDVKVIRLVVMTEVVG